MTRREIWASESELRRQSPWWFHRVTVYGHVAAAVVVVVVVVNVAGGAVVVAARGHRFLHLDAEKNIHHRDYYCVVRVDSGGAVVEVGLGGGNCVRTRVEEHKDVPSYHEEVAHIDLFHHIAEEDSVGRTPFLDHMEAVAGLRSQEVDMDPLYEVVVGLSEDRHRLLQATCSVEEDLRDNRVEADPDCVHSHRLLQVATVALIHDHHLQHSSKLWQLLQPLLLLTKDCHLPLEDCYCWEALGFPTQTRAIDSVLHDDWLWSDVGVLLLGLETEHSLHSYHCDCWGCYLLHSVASLNPSEESDFPNH